MDPADELALLVKAAQRAGDRRVNDALRPLGLTAAQAEVLVVLAAAAPLSLGELGGLLVAEGGPPSRLVDRLVAAGHVDRRPSAADSRRLELRLTAAGADLARRAAERKRKLLDVYRPRLAGVDLGPMRTLLEGYLVGTPWEHTVARRRALDRGERPT